MRRAGPRAYGGGVSDNPFGFALPGGEPPDPRDPQQMQQFIAQLQQLLASSSAGGPVNWELARQIAASQLATTGDPPVSSADRQAVVDALRLADLWLDPRTSLPSGVRPPPHGTGTSGSTTPWRCGRSCATRSPHAWSGR